jgi:pilus assembly protein CpaE
MKDSIRVLLVDTHEESRSSLLAQMEQMDTVWVTEVCVTYSVAAKRVAEIKPDLTVVVVDVDRGEAANAIRTITEDVPGATILAACRSNDSRASLNLASNGAREILTLPVESELLLKTMRRLTLGEHAAHAPVTLPAPGQAAAKDEGPKSRTIVVTGASGEVGCTSLAVNLGTTLAKTSGREVVIADFELMFGAVDTLLDIMPENTLSDIVRSVNRLDFTLLKRMLCRHASGLYVLPRPVELHDAARLDPESLSQTLALLRSTFSAVVLDTSKSLQTSDFVAFEAADVILVVVQLDLTSVKNTARLIHCLRDFEGLAERIQIVANRVGSLRSSVSLKTAEVAFKMPVTWQIPNATKAFHAARDRGVPIDAIAPRSEAQRMIAQMAKALVPSLPSAEPKPQRGFFRDRFQRES